MQNDKNTKQNQNSPHWHVSFQTLLRRSLDPRHYTSRPSFQMSDVGCRISDVGCRISDVRCRMSNLGCRMSNLGCPMSDFGCRMSDGTYKLPQLFHFIKTEKKLKNLFRISEQSQKQYFDHCKLRSCFETVQPISHLCKTRSLCLLKKSRRQC